MKSEAILRRFLALAGSSMLAASYSHALDGTWNVSAGAATHNWTDTGMWASGQIATGADYTANFTGIDITGTKTVSLNGTNRTIGNITFTDATTSSNKLVISGNTLTLDRTSGVPVINVTNQEIEITSTLAGNDGLVITGGGALRLNGTNSLTGGLTINAGALISQNANRFGTNLITLGDVANTGALTSLQVTTAGPFSNDINVRGNGVNEIRNFSAGSTWSGAIDLVGNLLFYDRQNGTTANVISGVISGTGNLTFQNRDDTVTNVLTLSNTNTFTGSTTITSGILSLTNLNSLQYSYIDTTASVAGDANDGLRTNQTTLKLGGLSGNKNLTSIFTTSTGGYGSVNAITLDVLTTNNLTYSGAIDGARSLTKAGAGTQVFSGANTYTGATNVNAGTLLVNGTHITTTGSNTYTVSNSGSTLGGTGRIAINGAITVASTATLAPGASIGTLTLDGANVTGNVLTMSTGSNFSFELDGSGGTPDQLAFWNYLTGDLTLNSNTLNLSLLGTQSAGTYTVDIFRFFSNAGTTATTHAFSSGLTIGTLGTGISSASIDWNGTGDNNQSIALTYTVIPEPHVALMGGLGVLLLLRRRR